MNLDKSFRKLLGLPTKEDRLIAQIENLQTKTDLMIRIPQLTKIMDEEVAPRLREDIHNLEAIGMLNEIIHQFEGMLYSDTRIQDILDPLYDIRNYAYAKNVDKFWIKPEEKV